MKTSKHKTQHTSPNAAVRWSVQTLIFLLIFGVCLFLSSGRFNWLQGWLYMAVYLAGQIMIGAYLVPNNPQLVTDRTSVERSTARVWDRPLAGIVSLFGPMAILLVCGLDDRFGWSGYFLGSVQTAGLIVIIQGTALVAWAIISNRFFYGFVRIQEEKGHTVVMNGPYRYIRHPGYLSGILVDLGAPLLLGSWWGFIPAGVTVIALILRTALEDQTLLKELSGYQEYARQVPCRLFPWVW